MYLLLPSPDTTFSKHLFGEDKGCHNTLYLCPSALVTLWYNGWLLALTLVGVLESKFKMLRFIDFWVLDV